MRIVIDQSTQIDMDLINFSLLVQLLCMLCRFLLFLPFRHHVVDVVVVVKRN